MRELRATKRRKVSNYREGEDSATSDGGHDIYSVPPSTSDEEENDVRTPDPPSRRLRPRSSTAREAQKTPESRATTETPSKSGLRSSGRQRKTPKRYAEEFVAPPPSAKRVNATPMEERRTTRSMRRQLPEERQVSEADGTDEEDETDEEPLQPRKRSLRRTRPKRYPVRFCGANDEESSEEEEERQKSPAPDDDQDDVDDLVAMQLQQDLIQHELEKKDISATKTDPLPEYGELFRDLTYKGLNNELRTLAKIVLEKLTGKRLVPLKGLENEYQKVHQLIEQTVIAGEGNSMLLLGSRGCGKTTVVETIISSLAKGHRNDFHVVRLNGFLHTDDRLAIREMWRQLGRETNTEDDVSKVSSYADTMTTLLALLSHPEELFGPSENAETVTAAKSIIIVVDEFDLFVSHPRQTLLYNLFDIAQARKAPIAVIGLTTRVDVTEMLEKRVKSRFSHRSVFLALPRSFEIFSDICFAGLNLDDGEISELTGAEEDIVMKSEGWGALLEGWRAYLKGLWNDKEFHSHLQGIYYQTKSVKEFFASSIIPVTEMLHSTYNTKDDDPIALQIPTPKDFIRQSLSCPDPAPLPFSAPITISASSTSLPLSLLLAATRLTALYDAGVDGANPQSLAPLALSFPAAYAEYVRLLTSAKVSASVSGAAATPGRVWGRDVAREAWEKLVSWGLVVPVGGGSGVADGRMFRVEVSFEEAVEMVGSGGSLGKWWRNG